MATQLQEIEEGTSEQTLEALVYMLVERTNELIRITNAQNEMLGAISDQVGPALEALQASPLGMFLGQGK